MTIAATLVMWCIMIFRLPNASLGAYYTLLFARDSARATVRSVTLALASIAVSLLYIILTVRIFAGEPFLHFMWVAGTLLIIFFLISSLSEYLAGTAFGFLAVTAITAWDFPGNTKVLFENTLWTGLAVALGALATLAVELIARQLYPTDEFNGQLLDRMHAVEQALRSVSKQVPVPERTARKLAQYALTGTATLRQLLARSVAGAETTAQMSATVALAGRLVDLTAHVTSQPSIAKEGGRAAFGQAADRLNEIEAALANRNYGAIAALDTHFQPAEEGSLLADIGNTINRFPEVFSGLTPLSEYLPSALDFNRPKGLFKDDAFNSVTHVHFALKGTLAALSCYFLYNAVDWHGLSNSVSTCMITALSTVGSSRQKQMLRVAGAILGSIVLGMTAQIFILPFLNGIGDFTLLFVFVTAIASWIATASPRIAYAGVQTAFAFYVTHLRGFGPQLSLTVARDDVIGILFGLLMMWVTFDRIWIKDTRSDLASNFVANLRRIAHFNEIDYTDLRPAIDRARTERAAINTSFDQIRNGGDALIFEFGTEWEAKVHLRNQLRRWQPQLRTYFILNVALLHYRLNSDARALAAGAHRNAKQSGQLLLLLADLQDPAKQAHVQTTQGQIDREVEQFDEARNHEGEQYKERNHPERLAHSMLEVATALAKEMRAPATPSLS